MRLILLTFHTCSGLWRGQSLEYISRIVAVNEVIPSLMKGGTNSPPSLKWGAGLHGPLQTHHIFSNCHFGEILHVVIGSVLTKNRSCSTEEVLSFYLAW